MPKDLKRRKRNNSSVISRKRRNHRLGLNSRSRSLKRDLVKMKEWIYLRSFIRAKDLELVTQLRMM